MAIYNHYYSRGYAIEKSADGNHRPPSNFSQGSGYSTVGCSKGLRSSIIDLLESSSFMDFGAGGEENVKSLYMYPRFSESKGQRFAILGQAVTHMNNFADSRPNYFAHNVIIGVGDLCKLMAERKPELILGYGFKDSYVDGTSKAAANAVAYQSCIDAPIELEDYARNVSANTVAHRITAELAKAIISGLARSNSHCVICLGDNSNTVDQIARGILYSLYMWLPQKMLQNLGFITRLNSSKSHKTCNLMFCDTREFRDIQNNGLGDIRASAMTFIDAAVPNASELQAGFNADDLEYISWLAKCISGDCNATDEAIRQKTDEQELMINQRVVPFGMLSKIHKLVVCQHNHRIMPNEATSRSLGIAAFALLNVTASYAPDAVDRLLPQISSELGSTIINGQVDALIIDIDTRFPGTASAPGLIDRLLPYLGEDVAECVSEIRIYKSTLSSLRAMCNDSTSIKNIARVVEGAKLKYREKSFVSNEVAFGYEIGKYALSRNNWSAEVQANCKELFRRTFEECDAVKAKIFTSVTSIDAYAEALAVIELAKGKVTIKDCDYIMNDIAGSGKEQHYNVLRKMIQNTRTLPFKQYTVNALSVLLVYVCKLCISNDYETQNLLAFSKLCEPKEQFEELWHSIVDLSAQMFVSGVAKGADAFKILRGVIAVISSAPKKQMFVEKIAAALTMLVTSKAVNESAHAKNLNAYKATLIDIYSAVFKGCSENALSAAAQSVKNIICNRTVENINEYPVDSKISERYKQTLVRERATALKNICQKLKNANEFECFWLQLGIQDYPVYAKSGGISSVVENLYKAFECDEDRKEHINARVRDMFNLADLSTIGIFSNSASAKADALSRIIIKKGTDSELYQRFSEELARKYSEKMSFITAADTPLAEKWSAYISLYANSLIYSIGALANVEDISDVILNISDKSENGSLICAICKIYQLAKSDIANVAGGNELYDELVRKTRQNRRIIEQSISSKAIKTDHYAEIAALISADQLDNALLLFPDAVNNLLSRVENGEKEINRGAQKNLSAKLHHNRNSEYCSDAGVDEKLRYFLKKHPRSNITKWVSAAAVLLIAALGVALGVYLKQQDESYIQTISYQNVSYSDFYREISAEVQSGDIAELYRVSLSEEQESNVNLIDYLFNVLFQPEKVSDSDVSSPSDVVTKLSVDAESCFGQNESYAYMMIAYIKTVYENDESELSTYSIISEEKIVPVEDGKLVIDSSDSSVFNMDAIRSGCEVYIAQIHDWNAAAKVNEMLYPSVEAAVADITYPGKSEVSGSDVIRILEDTELGETILVERDILITSEDEQNFIIGRKPDFTGEFFHIKEGVSLTLDGIIVDGGAQWVEYVSEEAVTSEPQFDIETALTVSYDRAIPGAKEYWVDATITNTSSSDIINPAFSVRFDPETVVPEIIKKDNGEYSFSIECSDDRIVVDDSMYQEGILWFRCSDSDDNKYVLQANESLKVRINFSISETAETSGDTTISIDSVVMNQPVETINDAAISEAAGTVSSSDKANETGETEETAESDEAAEKVELSFNGISSADIRLMDHISDDRASVIKVFADGNEVELDVPFNPEKDSYLVSVPYNVQEIIFEIETFSDTAEVIWEVIPEKLAVGRNIYYFRVSDESNKLYFITVNRMEKYSEYQSQVLLDAKGLQNIGLSAEMPLIVNYGRFELKNTSELRNNSVISEDRAVGGILNYGTSILMGEITGNSAQSDEEICVGGVWNDSVLTLQGGSISYNSALNDNSDISVGGIYNNSGAELNLIEQASVCNNSAKGTGGIYNNGQFCAEAAIIADNNAGVAGGVFNDKKGEASVNCDSVISENVSKVAGGIYNCGDFYITDSCITANEALTAEGYGGVFNNEKDGFKIAGSVRITGNTVKVESAEIISNYFSDYPIVIDGDLKNTAIGVAYCEKEVIFAEAGKNIDNNDISGYSDLFFSDKQDGYTIIPQRDGKVLAFSDKEIKYYHLSILVNGNGKISFNGERMINPEQRICIEIEPKTSMLKDIIVIDSSGEERSAMEEINAEQDDGPYFYVISEINSDTEVQFEFVN